MNPWERLPMFFEPRHIEAAAKMQSAVLSDRTRALQDPARVVGRLGELGLFSLVVPKDGPLDVRMVCLAREILARYSPLADAIFAVQGLAAQAIALADPQGQKELLASLASGASVGAFALTEPEAGSDVASMRAFVRRHGDAWALDGEKTFISNAGIASCYVVFATVDPAAGKRGISTFLVDARAKGLTVEPIPMSSDHPLGTLKMNACRAVMLGEEGKGLRVALGTLDTIRTSVGAAAVGMAERALECALTHVKQRAQFGKKLAEFQLTQAAIAEMATELDAARLLVYRAAWAKDRRVASKTDVAMAKMYATEAAQRIIDRAVQLEGGRGVTRLSPVEHLYRDIRPLRIYEGTTEIQKLIIGNAVIEEHPS